MDRAFYCRLNMFASGLEDGNPAGVFLHHAPVRAEWMQALAVEMKLPILAFVDVSDSRFSTRFITPGAEAPVSGHGSMSAAYALWRAGRADSADAVRLTTTVGPVEAAKTVHGVEASIPALTTLRRRDPYEITKSGLTGQSLEVYEIDRGPGLWDLMLIMPTPESVRDFQPDFDILRAITKGGLIMSALGSLGGLGGLDEDENCDYVCRYFAPRLGLPEDSVTGVAQAALAPYWAEKTGQNSFAVRQLSQRGGTLNASLRNDRIQLRGSVFEMFAGEVDLRRAP